MGIFTRVRDIVGSNINAMLDKAEDPKKLVRLLIREMEDTLVDVKAQCARAMAARARLTRQTAAAKEQADRWRSKAETAVRGDREDLAREALIQKRYFVRQAEALGREQQEQQALVEQFQSDIIQLEEKVKSARERQRLLVQRHDCALQKKRAHSALRQVDTSSVFLRFEAMDQRAENTDTSWQYNQPTGGGRALCEAIAELETDDALERELDELKAGISR